MLGVDDCASRRCGWQAFWGCALECIAIPPTVKSIDDTTFNECSNLTNVQFCDDIEEFVSGVSMRDWWDHGVMRTA